MYIFFVSYLAHIQYLITMQHVLAVDVETTGADIGVHEMFALGVALVHVPTRTVKRTAMWCVRPSRAGDSMVWETRCLAEFYMKSGAEAGAALLERMRREGLPLALVMDCFMDFVRGATAEDPNVVLVTDNAAFDVPWLNAALSTTKHPPLTWVTGSYRTVIDTDSYALGVAGDVGCAGVWGADARALRALGADADAVLAAAPPHTHFPDSDAARIGVIFATLVSLAQAARDAAVRGSSNSSCSPASSP